MKARPDKGTGIETRGSVFDSKDQRWAGIDHESPDEILNDKDLRLVANGRPSAEFAEFAQGLLNDAATLAGVRIANPLPKFEVRHEAWKTLVRYVWHNARSVAEACICFGVAALHLDRHFENRMQKGELKAIARRGDPKGRQYQSVFGFRREAVYRTFKPLTGYTPLAALIEGENGEWRNHPEAQAERRAALFTILRSAWQDIAPGSGKPCGKWERTLCAAFMNFTSITAEDRDLLAFVSQTEWAVAFDETRAAMCAREKRRVKKVKQLNGCKHFTAPGGKSPNAIEAYSEAQKGNHNRSGTGAEEKEEKAREMRALRADLYDRHTGAAIPIRPDLPRDPTALRVFLREQHDRAEQRRLAALCGCAAEEISIAKTMPTESAVRHPSTKPKSKS